MPGRFIAIGREDQLLLLSARRTADDLVRERIHRLVRQGIDWPGFVRKASHHRVVPLVARSLSRMPAGIVPAAALGELGAGSHAIAKRNLYQAAILGGVVRALEANNIPVIAYKGPVSAVLAYGDIGQRQFGDLDLLVDDSCYGRAGDVLRAQGYEMSKEWGWESSFDDRPQTVRIDLHRNISPRQFPIRFEFAGLYERRQTVSIAGRYISTLCAEDMLIILCIQLAKDAWGNGSLRLSKVCDIAELVRSRPEMDWRCVEARTNALGCRRILGVGTGIAEALLGTGLTGAGRRLSWASKRHELEGHVLARIFPEAADSRLGREAFHFKVRERWRDKLYPALQRSFHHLEPNERDRAMVSLPKSLDLLYFLVRPIRVARDRLFGRGGDSEPPARIEE